MKKYVATITILCWLASSLSFADQSVALDKGTPAPFKGYLIDQEKAQKVYQLSVDLNNQKHVNELLDDQIGLLNQEVNLSQKEVDSLSKELASNNSMLTKIGFFVLGAVITGGIAYGASRAVK